MTSMNRRRFFGAAAAAAAAAAGRNAFAASSSMPSAWDIETDVVVLGCGAAGLMAAVQAKDGGAEVMIFDKGLSPYHTSTRLNGGCFAACGSRMQKAAGVRDTPEDMANNINDYGSGMSLMEPLMGYAKNSGAAFDWLQDNGLAEGMWQPYNGHTIARTVRQKTYNGKDYIDCLVRAIEKRGMKINHDHALIRFFYDAESNRVLGVECGNNRESVRVRARKGVVMATGGITGSAAEVARWSPALKSAVPIGGGSNDGSALRIAVRDLGTPLTHMQFFAEYPYALAAGPGRGPQIRYQYFVDEGAMLVNREGKRFVKETLAPTQISPYMKLNSDKSMYVLMNEEIFEAAAKKYPFGALLSSPQWTRERWVEELAREKTVVQGDDLDTVAKKIGVDPEGLRAQLSDWNAIVEAKKDPQFGRTDMHYVLKSGPWIMAKVDIWICLSMGGLRTNGTFQVLGWDEKPINGIYAAGETIGGIHGEHYLGGDACGFAHTSGYVAGRALTGQPVA